MIYKSFRFSIFLWELLELLELWELFSILEQFLRNNYEKILKGFNTFLEKFTYPSLKKLYSSGLYPSCKKFVTYPSG